MKVSPVKNWRETKKIHTVLGKTGKILTWTKIYVAPASFELEAPYIVAIVEFEGGKRMAVQVDDCEEKDIHVGTKVMTIVRRIGKVDPHDVIEYGIKVKPV